MFKTMKKFGLSVVAAATLTLGVTAGTGYYVFDSGMINSQAATLGEHISSVYHAAVPLSERELVHEMHGMTHQKVVAEEKWFAVQMTQAKVTDYLNMVQNNRDQYVEAQALEHILTKWSKGDFSSVDEDHNFLWQLEGGTEGKATGVMTQAEEDAYVLEVFNVFPE